MSRSEKRIENNRIRRRRQLKKNILLSIFTSFLIITLSFSVNGFLSNAQSDNDNRIFKYYKSVMVEPGDTLWTIASENLDSSDKTQEELIMEIMKMNQLTDEQITAGSYLVVPYFSTDFVGQKSCF